MGIVVILLILLASPAAAQTMQDYCGSPLDLRADPGQLADWRMRCTIRKLDEERAEAEDKATQMEVNLAVTEAHLKTARAALDAADKTAEYWKKYVAGLRGSFWRQK